MQSEIDKKHETEHDDLERAPTGKGEMVEERIELSEEDVSHFQVYYEEDKADDVG